MIILVTAIGGAAILNSVFKVGLHRERPSIATHLTEVWSSSFPSGYAMISAATYLTVGMMLADTQQSRRVRIYVVSLVSRGFILVSIGLRMWLGAGARARRVGAVVLGLHAAGGATGISDPWQMRPQIASAQGWSRELGASRGILIK